MVAGMRLISRSFLPRPQGGAVRVLVVVMGGFLLWLAYIALLPPRLQEGEFLTFLGVAAQSPTAA